MAVGLMPTRKPTITGAAQLHAGMVAVSAATGVVGEAAGITRNGSRATVPMLNLLIARRVLPGTFAAQAEVGR